MRCFIGIDLPENLKKDIEKVKKDIENSTLFHGKFTKEENLHITLKFLGDVGEEQLEKIKNSLSSINILPFTCSIKSISAFPSKSFVKVLWLGINKGNKNVIDLHSKIENNLDGFSRDRVFTPHITLVRVKNISSKEMLPKFFNRHENTSFRPFEVSSFTLFQSTLTPNGPIYEKIKKFDLN